MILEWHRQGMSVSSFARQSGLDRKTVRKCIKRGLEAPAYGPRKPRQTVLVPFMGYLRERVSAFPGLTGSRLFREIKDWRRIPPVMIAALTPSSRPSASQQLSSSPSIRES
jgi:transposase